MGGFTLILIAMLSMLVYKMKRVSLKDANIEKFDASCNHEHEEEVNHLKVSLIQEKNDSSDVIGPKIFDVELFHHQNSSYLTVNYLKVISTIYKY